MLLELFETDTTFGGYPMRQQFSDLYLWERVLNEHPELRTLVELGTFEGGFSRFLHAQAQARGFAFWTFDYHEHNTTIPGFVLADVLADTSAVAERLAEHPLLLYCDDGCKVREVELYAPFLEPGDLLAVHDWLTEIGPGDIPVRMEPIYERWSEAMESTTRVFRVVNID